MSSPMTSPQERLAITLDQIIRLEEETGGDWLMDVVRSGEFDAILPSLYANTRNLIVTLCLKRGGDFTSDDLTVDSLVETLRRGRQDGDELVELMLEIPDGAFVRLKSPVRLSL